jgi:hypothetical protein
MRNDDISRRHFIGKSAVGRMRAVGRYLGRQVNGLLLDGGAVPEGKVEVVTPLTVGEPGR